MPARKAILFDRDGVINFRIVGEYIKDFSNFYFIPDFLEILPILKQKGYLIILISNQKGVGKGLMSNSELENLTKLIRASLIEKTGFDFDDIFYCTDSGESFSWELKPNPGMILRAVEKWNLDKSHCWMVGDSYKDILAGKRAGVNTVFVGLMENAQDDSAAPDFHITSLKELIDIVDAG